MTKDKKTKSKVSGLNIVAWILVLITWFSKMSAATYLAIAITICVLIIIDFKKDWKTLTTGTKILNIIILAWNFYTIFQNFVFLGKFIIHNPESLNTGDIWRI